MGPVWTLPAEGPGTPGRKPGKEAMHIALAFVLLTGGPGRPGVMPGNAGAMLIAKTGAGCAPYGDKLLRRDVLRERVVRIGGPWVSTTAGSTAGVSQ